MVMEYGDLLHDCAKPSTEHLPKYGERRQVIARWRCPECRQRWCYEAAFLHLNAFYWERYGRPSRRWRKAESARLRAMETTDG